MGKFFKNAADRYKRFLYGRYGHDSLNRFISILALAVCALSLLIRSNYLYFVVLILFAITLFRSLSKNITSRRRENKAYQKAAAPIKHYAKYWQVRHKSKASHYVYFCEKCRGILRVPKNAGQGLIEITCPKCHASFKKRLLKGR